MMHLESAHAYITPSMVMRLQRSDSDSTITNRNEKLFEVALINNSRNDKPANKD
jgi:hypothetical protein